MNYQQAEIDIVAKLTGITNVEAKLMYDTPEEFFKPIGNKTILNVLIYGSDFGLPDSTDQIIQEGNVTFEVILRTNKRHAVGLDVMREIEKRLVGFRPTDCQKMVLKSFKINEVTQPQDPFEYSFFFTAKTQVVEFIPDPTLPVVLITQVTGTGNHGDFVVP